ncbi:MAG: hypothetical protein NUW01_04505 [Gemmatimonadaceae bacterium]|nr:hypothetical protein [Gemmatimonadaceae bacterium]
MSDYWKRYEGILATDEDSGNRVAVFTEPLVVEGVLDGDFGGSDILISGLDLEYVFNALCGEKIRVTIERLP